MSHQSLAGRTALYRFFNASDVLLYVGITADPEVRWRAHEVSQYWWKEVHRKELQWLPSRVEAEEAERRAIYCENPVYDKSDRRAARTRLPALDQRIQMEEYTSAAMRLLAQDIRTQGFPPGAVLPSRRLLSDRYALPMTAVTSALWRLRELRIVTSARSYWIVHDPQSFPSILATKYGLLYALGTEVYGCGVFTRGEIQQRTQLAATVVATGLRDLRRVGLAQTVSVGRSGSNEAWQLLPEPLVSATDAVLEPEIGM